MRTRRNDLIKNKYCFDKIGKEIKNGLLSHIPNYHRITIDDATKNKENR